MNKLSVKKWAKDNFVGSRLSGQLMRQEATKLLKYSKGILTIDFSGVEDVTQSSMDEFLGVLVRERGEQFLEEIEIVNAGKNIKAVVNFVLNYSLKHMAA